MERDATSRPACVSGLIRVRYACGLDALDVETTRQ